MLDDSHPGVLERLSSAKVSGNLKLKEVRGDLDYIIALGAVALEINPAAAAMLNLHLAHDVTSYREARASALSIAKKIGSRKRWGFGLQEMEKIAKLALHHHLCPVCPTCYGRKYEVQPGTPMLSDRTCPKCYGTGKRPLPLRRGREIRLVLTSLEMIEHAAEVAVRARVRQE